MKSYSHKVFLSDTSYILEKKSLYFVLQTTQKHISDCKKEFSEPKVKFLKKSTLLPDLSWKNSEKMSSSGKIMSLSDIQAEQARDEGRKSSSNTNSNNNNNNNNNNRGGDDDSNNNRHRKNSTGPLSRRSSGGSGADGAGKRRGNDSRRGRGPDRSNLPLEHGCICSLKDKFGFIYCANRPTELFFHFSEVTNVNPADLQVDDEVEFRVGISRDSSDKLAAFEVYRFATGTIVWEYEESPGERFQGLVDRPLMRPPGNNRRNSDRDDSDVEGLIRLLVPAEEEKSSETTAEANNTAETDEVNKDAPAVDTMTTANGPKIRFTANDYNPSTAEDKKTENGDEAAATLQRKSSNSSIGGNPNRLSRGDLVEFTLVVEKRTRAKFARNIVVLQTERERAQLAKEKELLDNASLEQGVVVSLKQDFGFLRSNARRDEVYFHYSQVELPEEGEEDDEHELKIGQDMEFLVVTEEQDHKTKTSARHVTFLPKGTVEFEKKIVEGVTGLVSIVPRADASRNQQKNTDPQCFGSVRLSTPLSVISPESKEDVTVKTVSLHVADAPGGLFEERYGASMGLWIREGDKLLFDVVYDVVDHNYHARPTKHLVPIGSPLVDSINAVNNVENEEEKDGLNGDKAKGKKKKNTTDAAVRLIELCLAGRSEGTVHTVKEAFGFIHFAERPVDAHFKLFELLPDDVQVDLRRNMGLKTTNTTKADMMGFHQLTIGTEVQFDMSIHGTVMTQNAHPLRGGKKGSGAQNSQHERENLKAQRILILPPGTILQNKTLFLGAKGLVTKEDPNQPYAGTIDLEKELLPLTMEERHPLVVKLIETFMKDEGSQSLVFHDIQSTKEEDVISYIIDTRANGMLEMTHVPQVGSTNYAGRLCIRKLLPDEISPDQEADDTQAAEVEPMEAKEEVEADLAAGETSVRDNVSPKNGSGNSNSAKARGNKQKALSKTLEPIKTIRFDKSSLTAAARTELPPMIGDVVICDVQQSRKTAKVSLVNLSATERKAMDADEAAANEGVAGVGVVREVVLASKIGFITVADEGAAKRELLFFHFASLITTDHQQDKHQQGRGRKGAADAPIHKGDEVKFKIGTEKNGKRVAVDIEIVSSGVVASKPDSNACKGYILVEPTDTKVGGPVKPSHSFNRSLSPERPATAMSRWHSVDMDDDNKVDRLRTKGEGVILLLEDPASMFVKAVNKSTERENGKDGEGIVDEDEKSTANSTHGLGKFHLHYQNGALALKGAGAPTTMDTSTNPRRGDLVSFVKSKNGTGVKDVRVVTRSAATMVQGKLENVDQEKQTAKFVGSVNGERKEYDIELKEVVSCEMKQLKDNVEVEAIFHDDAIHGICRTTDLRLESKLGTGRKQRMKLNLTVKKDLSGKIVAQSMMAQGPDGTNGFAPGWTARVSKYAQSTG